MGAEKIKMFYDDPEKREIDAQSMAKAHRLRSLSTGQSLRWRVRRLIRVAGGYGRGVLQQSRES
jgi:hypothetical protein